MIDEDSILPDDEIIDNLIQGLERPVPNSPPSEPQQHDLDMVVPEIAKLYRDILKWRVDPTGEFYQITLDKIITDLKKLDTQAIVAIGREYASEEVDKVSDPILQSFVQGCGGRISYWDREANNPTPIVLRGITKRKEMRACKESGRDFYYIDTGYFGNERKKRFHRITKNDVQWFGPIIERPHDRLAATGVRPAKFRPGRNILLAPPSQKLLNLYNINLEEWMEQTIEEIKKHTDREIVTRLKKGRSERMTVDTMEMALSRDVHCLVTFSSIAAGEALLLGKPAITLGPNAAAPLCSHSISEIESLKIPSLDEVNAWAAHLAYCQFTEPEMRDGTAWRILNSD